LTRRTWLLDFQKPRSHATEATDPAREFELNGPDDNVLCFVEHIHTYASS
jgi:hypothetical protein